ncbi:vitamin K epoxide reductase family protein [Sphingomonas sp. BN140010]|uniref:Vitamin K epoxide reductase family protein n=1 Tax=Sphingomonas arvum TaxID=2992113 RepID=A0ABT3JGA1_9SPHN|nr:vitamin K epoxide reductase family protein [Sphingomonas sp. BN140010]MCW3798112.1 vitamin K epoxide reductase family protein [Sphingomonas sp. BN140010]
MPMNLLPPSTLSRELREGRSGDLTRRRWAIGLSFAGGTIGMIVAAYQTGMIKRLPDVLPGRIWDAEKVDASDYAYKRLQGPDGPLMMLTYAVTATLFATGGKERAEQQPWIVLGATAKAWGDLVTCLQLTREEWRDNCALCSWCQVATGLSAVTAVLSVPEALQAGRALLGASAQPA